MTNQITLQYDAITENEIPVILCYPADAEKAPLVLLNHGTEECGEDRLDMAVQLARRGMFTVVIDAVWHGRRADPRLQTMLHTSLYKRYYVDLLLEMAGDMTRIIDYFADHPAADVTRTGMTGVSQGGYVTFMTMTKDPRIKAAAPLIGSPDLEDQYGNSQPWELIDEDTKQYVSAHSPLHHAEKMAKTALLIQNSAEDPIVPAAGVRRLDKRLRPLYKNPADYAYIEYLHIGHQVTREMKDRAADWLAEKL